MSTHITTQARQRIAADTGFSDAYLYQCLSGRRDMNPAEARRLESVTKGELRRWDLCSKTWHRIWPELMNTKGAPSVPEPAKT